MTLEYRTAVDGEIKDADESKRQVLVTFPHERVDTYKTTFGNESFRESFSLRMPTMAWMHDMKEPIGRAVDAQVRAHSNDLIGQLSDFDAVPLARRAFAQIQDGSITDFSFGFQRIADEPHPEHRGVTRITKAIMQEFSPVMVGSIPGAVATGTRSDDGTSDGLVAASIEDILHLWDVKLIHEDEARAMLATHPEYREHITVNSGPPPADGLADWDPDVVELLARSAGGMEAAGQYLSDVDLTTLPEPVQSAIALMNASATALDEARSIVGEPPEVRGGDTGETGDILPTETDEEIATREAERLELERREAAAMEKLARLG